MLLLLLIMAGAVTCGHGDDGCWWRQGLPDTKYGLVVATALSSPGPPLASARSASDVTRLGAAEPGLGGLSLRLGLPHNGTVLELHEALLQTLSTFCNTFK